MKIENTSTECMARIIERHYFQRTTVPKEVRCRARFEVTDVLTVTHGEEVQDATATRRQCTDYCSTGDKHCRYIMIVVMYMYRTLETQYTVQSCT